MQWAKERVDGPMRGWLESNGPMGGCHLDCSYHHVDKIKVDNFKEFREIHYSGRPLNLDDTCNTHQPTNESLRAHDASKEDQSESEAGVVIGEVSVMWGPSQVDELGGCSG